ncbi:MAG: hypothetical protein R6X02_30385 [Enhygromyxa sp.]
MTDRLRPDVSLGHGPGVANPPVTVCLLEAMGEARRLACEDGRELWRLPEARAGAVEQLCALGRAGVGGFVDGGRDGEGPYVIRERADRLLAGLLGEHEGRPLAWRGAVVLVSSLARALAEAEARNLWPGLISPGSIVIEPSVWLRADAWVGQQVGAAASESSAAPLRREWLTPAAAAGQPEDASSNRWLLGLLLYRLLVGRGPFAGLGLRSAIDQLSRGVPPLPDAIARELPPGLQGLILRILAADPGERPRDAATIARELERFVAGEPSTHATQVLPRKGGLRFTPSEPPSATPERPSEPLSAPPASPAPARPRSFGGASLKRGLLVAAILGAGGLGGHALVEYASDSLAQRSSPTTDPPEITMGSRAPLDEAHTSPEDCASCHPRQSAEWKRSVMGHSAKSPLFQGLEILIQEQVGRSDRCPGGAGILRTADPRTACRDPETGIAITGSGGALWCVNCHTPRENLGAVLPAWDGLASASSSRRALRDLQPSSTHEGIDCGFCHQVHGPVRPGNERLGAYEGNPSWISTATGRTFFMRPEDRRGIPGIANSGYLLDPAELLSHASGRPEAEQVPGGVHRRPSAEAREYLRSSEFCGACHDVRLFGADAIATPLHGEHFRRLRNAYSEWVEWAALERAAGREPADCQDCHMSSFPGVCVPGDPPPPRPGETDISALRRGCPPGTRFESRAPGELPQLRVAAGSGERREVSTHYFSGVDIPLTPEFDQAYIDQPELDAIGIPLGGDQRRDLLLGRSFRFELGEGRIRGRTLELPIELENTGAGHKIPAGFSQEREFWVHLRVTDADDRIVYEVGRVDRDDEDLRDKIFVEINVDDRRRDGLGQPQGVFGAEVIDGPDAPRWQALDARGPFAAATQFRGRGLINLQNGFLRCVRCIGVIDREGRCQPANAAQARHRAARFADAEFDNDTGECRSNLSGEEALFEVYFPVGSLDASRGVVKGPDAIIDQRSAPPKVPMRWTYELELPLGVKGPLKLEARLLFRAFPPFLIEAFAAYEARQAAAGLRPSGPLVTREMLAKLAVVEIARVERALEL